MGNNSATDIDTRAALAVSGTVYGKQEARIVRVNQYRLEAVPEGDLILCGVVIGLVMCMRRKKA
jgi:hypothetical protein